MKLKRSEIYGILGDDERFIDELFLYNIEDIEHFRLYFYNKGKPYYVRYLNSKGAMVFNVDLKDYKGEDIYQYIDSLFDNYEDNPDELVECAEVLERKINITYREAALLKEERDVESKELFYVTTADNEDIDRIVFGCRKDLDNQLYSFREDAVDNKSICSLITCHTYPFDISEDTPRESGNDPFRMKNQGNSIYGIIRAIRAFLVIIPFLLIVAVYKLYKTCKEIFDKKKTV